MLGTVDRWARAAIEPAYTWPVLWRRAYVLTWPASILVRASWITALIIVLVFVGAGVYFWQYLGALWDGKEF